MLSLAKKRIVAFLFTALVVAPLLFVVPTPFGGNVAHAFTFGDVLTWVGGGVLLPVVGLVYVFFVTIPKLFLGIAGTIFDVLLAFSLSSTVIQNQDFVNKGWIIMRDLSNTFFIFILLYIAISTILQTAGGQTKRLLATLVMVALFMNFSLYITKFVIDVGNVFALEFYTNMGQDGLSYIDLGNGMKPKSIASTFVAAYDLEQLGSPGFKDAFFDPGKSMFFMILLGIMYLISTFVFLSAGFLFLGRVVAFWFLMVLGPLAFFSIILPYTNSKIWSRWKSELINQSFFLPIFLFFVYLAIMLSNSLNADSLFKNNGNGPDDIVKFILTFLNFFAVITVLLFGLKTAKSMSGVMGDSMLKIGGTVTGAGVGLGAFAGRNTLGRVSRWAGDKLGDNLDKTRTGRLFKSGLNTVASSSFDVRASKIGQTAQSVVGGINLGAAGGAGGHAAVVSSKQKDVAEHTKKLLARDPEAAAKYLASHEQFDPLGDRDTAAVMASLTYAQRAELIAKAKPGKAQDRLKSINESLGSRLTPKQQKEAAKEMSEVHIKTIERMGSDTAKKVAYLAGITDLDHKTEIYKKMTHKQRDEIETADPSIFAAIKADPTRVSAEEREQIAKAAQSSTETQKKQKAIEDLAANVRNIVAAPDAAAAKSLVRGMTPKDVANMDTATLTDPKVVQNLTASHVAQLANENKLAPNDQDAIIGIIMSQLAARDASGNHVIDTRTLEEFGRNNKLQHWTTAQQRRDIATEIATR